MHFFLILFFAALGTTRYVKDVPLFVWSGEESLIASRNQQIRGYYTTESVGDLLQGLTKTNDHKRGLLKEVNLEQQPELVVLVVNAALSSEELSLHQCCASTVGEIMESHPSFYVPYVTIDDDESSISASLWKACKHAKHNGGSAYYLGPDSLLERLEKRNSVISINAISEVASTFTNGKTDVLVVYLDGNELDKMMLLVQTVEDLENAFKTAQFTNYVVALTSAKSSLVEVIPKNKEMGIPEDVKRFILAEAPNNGTFPPTIYNGRNTFNVYFNGVFWELFAVLLVFWTIIFMGIRQLLQVQAPDKIPNLNAHKKKK